MTIQRTFHLVYGALLLLAIALAGLATLLFINQKQFEASEANRFRSFILAEELRQSGEELTRFARAYVVTGNERFRQSFRDIMAIRSGQKPRPEHYERIYWDFIAAGRTPPRGYEQAVPLLALMRQAGVTPAELAKLAQARAKSDALTSREDSAMYARDGLYDDGTGHFTRRGPRDVALAIRLTHDQAYHDAIADIRTPIDEFFGMLDARTAATVGAYSRRASGYLFAILGICGIMIGLKATMYTGARRRIWAPVAALQGQVERVATDLQRLADVTATIVRGERGAAFMLTAQHLRSSAQDEIGHLMRQNDEMIDRLQQTGTSIATLTARQTERFDQLFDQAPEGIALLDADDRVVRINGEFTRLFGYRPDEAEGQLLNDLVVPEGVSDGASQTKVRSLRGIRGRVSFDVVRRRKSGDLLHVSVLGVPVDVTSGDIKGLAIYRDVTERIESERARRQTEEQYRTVVETATDAVVTIGEDSTILLLNPAISKIFGYAPSELIGQSLTTLMPEPLRQRHEDGIGRYLRGGRRRLDWRAVELKGRRKNGEDFPIEVSFGEVIREGRRTFTGFIRDITERKQAEEARAALARQEALRADVHAGLASGADLQDMLQRCAQAIVDRVDAAFARIWTLNENESTLVLRASAGIYTRLDGSHSRVPVGQLKIGLIAQEKRPHATNDVVNDPRVSDKAWARKEGMVAFAGYPLLVGERVVGVMAMFSRHPIPPSTLDTLASVADTIAEGIQRRQAEQALKERERTLRQIIETIPDLVWSAAPDGSVDHVNQRVLDYNGKTLDDLPNNGWLSVIHPDDVEGAVNAWMQAVATGEPYATEFRHRRHDGVYRWFSSRALPLRDAEGRVVRWYGLLSDIEDRRNAAAALLEARAELAHVTRTTTMGEFAASLAHEVNQPLAAVVANAGACRRWLARKVPDLDEAKAALQRITRDGKRASDVITGMRALLQRTPAEFTSIDLTLVVRDVLDLIGPEVANQRVVVHRSKTSALSPVRGDRVQLQQVILNLITNAIQAMSGVTDRVRELRISLSRGALGEKPAEVVAVRDSGVGFRADESEKLFEAFYTTKPGGLGMGLAICRSIIEAHGGRLWASVNPDHGATFQFTLPAGS